MSPYVPAALPAVTQLPELVDGFSWPVVGWQEPVQVGIQGGL